MKGNGFLRLLRFEMRKAFLSPWMLIFLVALLCANGWRLQDEYGADPETAELYESFYARWQGTITAEKVEDLMTLFAPLNEKSANMTISRMPGTGTWLSSESDDWDFLYSNFATEMEFDYLYVNQAAGIVTRARSLAETFDQAGNAYEAAKNRAIASLFQGRRVPAFGDTRYIETWLFHDYSSMLVTLLCLFGLCTVFVSERETEMFMLQRTAKLGGGMTVAAKLTASALFVLVVCLLFYGEDILVLQLLSGHFQALSSPIYAITMLQTTGLRMSILQFIFWYSGVKTLGIFGISCVILLLSCLCRRVLTAFVTGFGAIVALALVQEFAQIRPLLKWFNPMELVMMRQNIYNVTFVNLFGIPVRMEIFILAGMAVTIVLLVLAILRFNPGRVERRR